MRAACVSVRAPSMDHFPRIVTLPQSGHSRMGSQTSMSSTSSPLTRPPPPGASATPHRAGRRWRNRCRLADPARSLHAPAAREPRRDRENIAPPRLGSSRHPSSSAHGSRGSRSPATPPCTRGARPRSRPLHRNGLALRGGLRLLRERGDVLRVEPTPGAVADQPGEPGVQEREETLAIGGVLLRADRVSLFNEGVPDDLGVRVLSEEPPEGQLVSADRVSLALLKRADARGVRVECEGPRGIIRGLDVRVHAGAALDADGLGIEICEVLDLVVGRADEDAFTGDEVRVAQVDRCRTLSGYGKPSHDDVGLRARERRHGRAAIDRDPLDDRVDVLTRSEDGLGELAPEVRLEAGVPAARIAARERSRFVERPDTDLALRLERVHIRGELEARVAVGDRVDGSGVLRHMRDVDRLSLRDLATLAVIVSDNTATNRLIERIGVDRVGERLREWGCPKTRLSRKMYDFEAAKRGHENVMTARETVSLLVRLQRGECEDRATSDAVLAVVEQCQDRTMLLRYLPYGAKVPHKTGTLDESRNDAAIVPGERPVIVAGFPRQRRGPGAGVSWLGVVGWCAYRAAGNPGDALPPELTRTA